MASKNGIILSEKRAGARGEHLFIESEVSFAAKILVFLWSNDDSCFKYNAYPILVV
jgi:hypothetical protein